MQNNGRYVVSEVKNSDKSAQRSAAECQIATAHPVEVDFEMIYKARPDPSSDTEQIDTSYDKGKFRSLSKNWIQ